jgi:hypothetical protein
VKKEILRLGNNDLQGNQLLYAISSSESDIRICQAVNKILGINLTLGSNLEINEKGKALTFRQYTFESREEIEKFTLVINKSSGNVLFKELKKIDYILMVTSEGPTALIEESIQSLRNLPGIIALYKLDSANLKTLTRLSL